MTQISLYTLFILHLYFLRKLWFSSFFFSFLLLTVVALSWSINSERSMKQAQTFTFCGCEGRWVLTRWGRKKHYRIKNSLCSTCLTAITLINTYIYLQQAGHWTASRKANVLQACVVRSLEETQFLPDSFQSPYIDDDVVLMCQKIKYFPVCETCIEDEFTKFSTSFIMVQVIVLLPSSLWSNSVKLKLQLFSQHYVIFSQIYDFVSITVRVCSFEFTTSISKSPDFFFTLWP